MVAIQMRLCQIVRQRMIVMITLLITMHIINFVMIHIPTHHRHHHHAQQHWTSLMRTAAAATAAAVCYPEMVRPYTLQELLVGQRDLISPTWWPEETCRQNGQCTSVISQPSTPPPHPTPIERAHTSRP